MKIIFGVIVGALIAPTMSDAGGPSTHDLIVHQRVQAREIATLSRKLDKLIRCDSGYFAVDANDPTGNPVLRVVPLPLTQREADQSTLVQTVDPSCVVTPDPAP